MNTFAGKTVAANIQSCFNTRLSASVEYCGGQDGHYVIRLSHLVIARRLLKSVGTLISLSLPISITLFQVSYWSTSGQKSYVYFLFFLTAKFLVENWIWCPGARWKIGQNSLFPPRRTICYTLGNEWRNKIPAGVAILCRGCGPCNLEFINLCLQHRYEYWRSVSECRKRISLSTGLCRMPPLLSGCCVIKHHEWCHIFFFSFCR